MAAQSSATMPDQGLSWTTCRNTKEETHAELRGHDYESLTKKSEGIGGNKI